MILSTQWLLTHHLSVCSLIASMSPWTHETHRHRHMVDWDKQMEVSGDLFFLLFFVIQGLKIAILMTSSSIKKTVWLCQVTRAWENKPVHRLLQSWLLSIMFVLRTLVWPKRIRSDLKTEKGDLVECVSEWMFLCLCTETVTVKVWSKHFDSFEWAPAQGSWRPVAWWLCC